ncbi:MAG: mechanosensitive ion channel [Caldilineaceae bacterium]
MNLENETIVLADESLLDALRNQIDTIWLILERPVVQRQLAAFLVLIFVAWLAPWLLKRSLEAVTRKRRSGQVAKALTRWQQWQDGLARVARAVGYTFFPILGLVLGHLLVNLFAGFGWHSGLIERLLPLFWLLLAYRILAGILHAIFEPKQASRYHARLLAPLSLILTVVILRSTLTGALPLGGIPLVTILDTPIALGALFSASVILYLFLTVAWVVGALLDRSIATTPTTSQGAANTVLVISRYAIIGLGILIAVSTLGFNLSALTIIGGGLSVGIGFGLQELIANFVSGILLLFERTLRPGDVIEIDGHRGVVDQLRMRATVVRTADNVEVFVPNKNILTSTMATYTQTDRVVRRVLRIGVSYTSEPTEVRDILLGVAERHGRVLKKPEPVVFFVGFGASSLDFDLAVWIDDPLNALRVTSDLYFMIWSEFKKHEIEIPFPQQDLHLRSVSWPAPLAPSNGNHQNGDSTPNAVTSTATKSPLPLPS